VIGKNTKRRARDKNLKLEYYKENEKNASKNMTKKG
jgi:hypothetical protein